MGKKGRGQRVEIKRCPGKRLWVLWVSRSATGAVLKVWI